MTFESGGRARLLRRRMTLAWPGRPGASTGADYSWFELPGGVSWERFVWLAPPHQPSAGPAAKLGRPQTIAGHQAWLLSRSAASDPTCRMAGASRVVEAAVSAGARTSYQMLVSIRGPNTGQSVKTVMAMLNSLRLGEAPGA